MNTKKVVGWIELVEDPLQLEGEQHNSAKPVVDESALVHPLGGELVEGSPHGRRWEDVAPTGQQPRVEQSAQHARTEKLVIHLCIRVQEIQSATINSTRPRPRSPILYLVSDIFTLSVIHVYKSFSILLMRECKALI